MITTSSLNDIYENKITEGLTLSCEDNGKGFFQFSNLKQILDNSEECDSVLIGPGLGNHHSTLDLITALYQNITKPLVVDADGLKPFFNDKSLFSKINSDFAITPHMGELSKAHNYKLLKSFPKSENILKKCVSIPINCKMQKNVPILIKKSFKKALEKDLLGDD